MKRQIWTTLLSLSLTFVSGQSNGAGGASYTPLTTISLDGPGPTNTNEAPPIPTQTTPAVPANAASYKLNSSFEITDTPVTRTFDWTIS
jgi:hypothetical protein